MVEKVHFTEALKRTEISSILAEFDPHIVGTPPLGVDLPQSDLDVVCYAPDPQIFCAVIWSAFAECEGFSMRQWVGRGRPIIASFVAFGWQIELFGQILPVQEQQGWKHFIVEQRLLRIGGKALRAAVMDHRTDGAKTEPAFAAALGLDGDPYQALLEIAQLSDAALTTLLNRRGFEHS